MEVGAQARGEEHRGVVVCGFARAAVAMPLVRCAPRVWAGSVQLLAKAGRELGLVTWVGTKQRVQLDRRKTWAAAFHAGPHAGGGRRGAARPSEPGRGELGCRKRKGQAG